jgi:DNA-binding transcriptional regulator GbsR (MarR family)
MTLSLPLVLADMAPLLGLSRPAAQCLGAIWRAAQAPSAEDLVAQLGLSRSNVSVSVK